MRILVVSDIHANWAALAAIDQPFDVCLCLGDLVDYGPDPAPCVRWAMDACHLCDPRQPRPRRGAGYPGQRRDRLPLPDAGLPAVDVGRPRARGAALPAATAGDPAVHARRQAIPPGPCHAPRPARRVPAQGPETWAKRLQNVDADIVCVGHTHMQFNLEVNGDRGPQPRQRRPAARRRPARRATRSSTTTRSR